MAGQQASSVIIPDDLNVTKGMHHYLKSSIHILCRLDSSIFIKHGNKHNVSLSKKKHILICNR